MLTLLSLCAAAAVAALVILSQRRLQSDAVPSPKPGEGVGPLSVIVAVQNEVSRIGEFLHSILAQDHPDFEVIVVDDRSRDGTADAVREVAAGDARLSLLRVDAQPPGWQGRLHAQGVGAEKAKGEWLLFLSADERLARSDFLRSVVAEYERRGNAAVAVIGPFVGESWWHRWWVRPILNSPAVLGTILLLQRWVPGSVWLVGALGMRRATYEAVGGAGAALACGAGLYEDLGWARACAKRGIPALTLYHPALLDGTNWEGPVDAWQGLTRWIAGVFSHRRGGWFVGGALIGLLTAILAGALQTATALATGRPPAFTEVLLAATAVGLGLSYCRWDARSPWFAPMFLVIGWPTVGVLLAGLSARLTNRVTWRGEVLRVMAEPPPTRPHQPNSVHQNRPAATTSRPS
jgi:GT2 family glycosyltransferase